MRALSRLRDGLVGAWCPSIGGWGGNVLRDLSGRGNHGILNNMDPATDWIVSGGKQALDFDGVDDFVACNNAGRLISGAKSATFSAWFYKSNVGRCAVRLLGTGDFSLFWEPNEIFYVYCYRQGQTGFPYPYHIYNKNLLSWVNFTVVYDATEPIATRCKAFANGEQIALVPNGGDIQDTLGSFSTLTIGSDNSLGQIDDIRIYNRALSPNEIRLLASERGIGLRPERTRRLVQGQTFTAARLRRQSLIGSGVY